MNPTAPHPSRIRQALRFDGLWWREFAYLGCVYGPEWWKRYSPPAIGAIIFLLARAQRQGAIANMERITASSSRTGAALNAVRMFANFAHCFTETMEFYGPSPRPIRIDIPAEDAVGAALQGGHGAVILTAHFGNWDIAAKKLSAYERPVNVVMTREVNITTQEYLRAARERAGVRVIYSDSSVFSSLNMIRALRRNEIVAMQLDRLMGQPRLIPFFGVPTEFPAGPFILARIAKAPLIAAFIPRLGSRHYAIRLGVPRVPQGERGDVHALDRVMATVVGEFEQYVRQHPTQWFQFAAFWRDERTDRVHTLPSETVSTTEPTSVRRFRSRA